MMLVKLAIIVVLGLAIWLYVWSGTSKPVLSPGAMPTREGNTGGPYRRDRGVPNPPPVHDRVPVFADVGERAERARAEPREDVGLHPRWCGEQPEAGAAEGFPQRAVGKLADDFGLQAVLLESGVDGAAQRIA